MKVHLTQIPNGGTLHLEGEEDAAELGLNEAGAEAVSPLFYHLDVGVSDGGIFAAGQVSVRVAFTCVKCLERFEEDIVVDPFGLQKELENSELVDLTPEIREDIHLALPSYPRCDEGGRKTCPASFPQAPVDKTDLSGAPAWDALDQLKTKD
jgi:uncharacterized metal-binding protein YceD (DUF177 family)